MSVPFLALQKAISNPEVTHLLLLELEKKFQSTLSLERSREYFQYLFGETQLSEDLMNIRVNFFINEIGKVIQEKNEQTIQKPVQRDTAKQGDLFR